jgi:hypothetical protein
VDARVHLALDCEKAIDKAVGGRMSLHEADSAGQATGGRTQGVVRWLVVEWFWP